MLRHGNTFHSHEKAVQVGCKTDLPLTDKGLAQAQSFAQFLLKNNLQPAAIYSGSLQRQVQSAQILHETFKEAFLSTHESALDEIDYGLWEGLTSDAITASWPTEYTAWKDLAIWPEHIFHGAFEHHIELLKKWLETVSQTAEQRLIIAISSNGIMRMMLHFIPSLWQTLVDNQKMEEYKVGTGHYCDLTINNLVPTIQSWNVKP
jgi:broad specificity phosphatase PhoE